MIVIKCRRCGSPNTRNADFRLDDSFSYFKRTYGIGYICKICKTKFLLNVYITDQVSIEEYENILNEAEKNVLEREK